MYFTDRGIEELAERRGEEQVTLGWLAAGLQAFADLHPDFDVPVDRFATWLARVPKRTNRDRALAGKTVPPPHAARREREPGDRGGATFRAG